MIDHPTSYGVMKAYRFLEDHQLPEFEFGEFVKIHKVPELTSGSSTNLPATVESRLPTEKNDTTFDYAGMLIYPKIVGWDVHYLIATVSGEEKFVPSQYIESWLEPVQKNVAFFNREMDIMAYINRGIKNVDLKEFAPFWRLIVVYGGGFRTVQKLIDIKTRKSLPAPKSRYK